MKGTLRPVCVGCSVYVNPLRILLRVTIPVSDPLISQRGRSVVGPRNPQFYKGPRLF